MSLIYRLLGYAPLLIACGLIGLLESRFSLGMGAVIYCGAVLLTTLAGVMLLRSAAVGQTGRRNIWGSRLLPWAWIGGYGSLLRLGVFNIIGSTLFGAVCFAAARYFHHNDYSIARVGGPTIACSLIWVVLIGMILFLFRQFGKRYYAGPSGLRSFLKLLAAPAGALAASISLFAAGQPSVAFIVGVIPIAIVFVPMAFLVGIVVATKISGKPVRWN